MKVQNDTAMTLAEVTTNMYTCLEMLTASGREDLHAWWCNLLYKDNGDINNLMWTEYWLAIVENDLIYNA